MHRRGFIQLAASASLMPLATEQLLAAPASGPRIETNILPADLDQRLDREISAYMGAMNAPGLAFSLTSLHKAQFVAAYGYENIETRLPLSPARLFQIGSISKSMAAVLALQLVDEKKLDLHRPVMEYLPWLPWECAYGPITTHHILTHTTGLPEGGPLFFANKTWKHRQRYAPGEHFFYSNMAFNVIGHLVSSLDGRTYQASLQARLFAPLGMDNTRPQLGGAGWADQAVSYIPAVPDRPFLRFDKLRQAPCFHEQTSAGCVASTPADMTKYMRFLLRRGVSDDGRRLLSDASFAAMTHRWIAADEFGPTASYGYGIAVDDIDGDHVLLHTGGMISFMSSIYLNLTGGTGAFASINAQQGYRPTPVTKFAATALRAVEKGCALRDVPALTAPPETEVKDPDRYVGRFATADEKSVAVFLDGPQLLLEADGKRLPLHGHGNVMFVQDEMLGRDSWQFQTQTDGVVVAVGHASELYWKYGVERPDVQAAPVVWQSYTGAYVNDDPWVLSSVVHLRGGELYLDDARLVPADDHGFYIASETFSPDIAAFDCDVNGKAQILFINGTELRRFERT